MHPRSKHWHQLDLIITRREHLHTICTTCMFHFADCDSNHSLVITKVRINAAATSIPEKAAKFQDLLNSKLRDCSDLEAKECWDQIRDTTLAAAIQAFGKTKTKSQDWFDTNIVTLQPLIEAKRDLLLEHQKNPSPETLAALRLARSHAKEECTRCANKFWLDLCSTIQVAADTGNIRAMFEGIKKAIGPTLTTCAPQL